MGLHHVSFTSRRRWPVHLKVRHPTALSVDGMVQEPTVLLLSNHRDHSWHIKVCLPLCCVGADGEGDNRYLSWSSA